MSSEGLSDTSDRSVSSREDLSERESEESREESEEDGVAVAQPPRAAPSATEHAVALTGRTALDELDRLLASNQIGKERAAKLRRKYNLLTETLENSRVLENSLLIQTKELGQQLSQQRRVLERSASFPEGGNSEASRLRQVLLERQNELDQAQERVEKLQREVERQKEERDEVQKEYDRLPKREELEHHRSELRRQCDELRDEISLRSQDAQRYREELDRKNYKISAIMKEVEEMKTVEEKLQEELINIRAGPNIPKEIDAVRKQMNETKERIGELNEFVEELRTQIQEVEGRTHSLMEERTEAMIDLKKEQAERETRTLDMERLGKDLDTAKEREATLLEDRATLELQWRHRGGEHRTLFEALSTRNKEKDRELKLLKKAELQLGVLRQSVDQQLHRRCVNLERKVKEGGEAAEERRVRREEVKAEVEQLRKGLTQTEGVEEGYHKALEDCSSREQQLKAQARRQQALLHDLGRDIVTVTKSRDREARQFYKTRQQQHTVADHLRTQEGEEREQRKRLRELEGQLKDFAEAYDVVKAERNRTHAQIQVMQQLGAELREKIKILQNEIEILVMSAENKEALLQKCSLVQTSKVLERDTQRQELGKLRLSQDNLNTTLQEQREELQRLTQHINTTEHQLNRLRRQYEQAVQERNDLGLQLIERNEEVCVFYERRNVSESLLRKAGMELSAREEELHFLRMELAKVQNDVLVSRKALPEKTKLEEELTTAQVELKVCEKELRRLEQAVECASDPSRIRQLPGENPSLNELRDKIETLESQLAGCEQKLLEKELLHEQVGRLVERVGVRVEGGREGTLEVARKVNHYQAKIKETTRKMMALVSELSMQQASALRLQQEVRSKETELEQAYSRLEAGEPPNEQAEREWEREVREERRRRVEAHTRRKILEDEEAHLLPGGALTTADPRPNAYVPSGEGDLPLPKPYGCHAPFKPSEPGANMRHIRKPEPIPIDI